MTTDLPRQLAQLRLPLIGAPMFLVSGVELVVAQCQAGIVGAFPSLNARSTGLLDEWLGEIESRLTGESVDAPFAVNLICHPSNKRLDADLACCVEHQVPLVITSLHPPAEAIQAVHAYGGIVLHDVINTRHASRAVKEGVDGLILVAVGAGGHGGTLNPFAFIEEVRQWYQGVLVLAGGISTGRSLAAAIAAGANFAYMGTRFIATEEASAAAEYKQMLVNGKAADILYSDYFTGVKGNYLKPSIREAGFDPDKMPAVTEGNLGVLHGGKTAWRDIWSAGQGVGSIGDVRTTARLVDQLEAEFRETLHNLRTLSD